MNQLAVRSSRKRIMGVIHLPPLPGTPFHKNGTLSEIIDQAVASACALDDGGADGCLVQTVDRVYTTKNKSDPARIAAMSLVISAIAAAASDDFHIGVHMLRNALDASLAVAKVAGGTYIRAGALVGRTQTTHGLVQPNPLRTMEYRNKIDAGSIAIIADIYSMHFQWDHPARSVAEVAKNAQFVGADAVALGAPDAELTLQMAQSVRAAAPKLPVILAGYTNHDNIATLIRGADGAFVGSCLERDGWGGTIDPDRVKSFMEIVRAVEAE